jgi:hypothetical protein
VRVAAGLPLWSRSDHYPHPAIVSEVVLSQRSEKVLRMVSQEALKLNEILRNAPKAVDMDLPHQREAASTLRT